MAYKQIHKSKTKFKAVLVTGKKVPCIFCQREVDDEIVYGKLYAVGNIQCHYFCVLLSCCLVQKGKDEEGLFGFLYSDILAEVERSKKHRCSYCGRDGATLGCSISQCRKQFHLPCGRERNAVSMFYGNYKSFCQIHAPKQKIADNIMVKAKQRMSEARKNKQSNKQANKQENTIKELSEDHGDSKESVCVICYEVVEGYPTTETFWPPCCARDAWFHRSCLQRMALSAGMHYLKCPLCNDKENFYDAVLSQGYYIPDRDAAWELEQNAFAEIYERPLSCSAEVCHCPMGRDHDAETGMWDIKLCILCGSTGMHEGCFNTDGRFVCDVCKPAAPEDLERLQNQIESVIIQEQANARTSTRRGPVMPSRMSLRRTKQRFLAQNTASSSRYQSQYATKTEQETERSEAKLAVTSTNTITSRQELNLKTPKKPIRTTEAISLKDDENKLLSPLKLIEQGLKEKASVLGVQEGVLLDSSIVEEIREKFKKPKPLREKKKIVNDILERIFKRIFKESPKNKEPVKEWNSPKKTSVEIEEDLKESQDVPVEVLIEKPDDDTLEIRQSPSKTPEKNTFSLNNEIEIVGIATRNANDNEIDDDSSRSTFQLPPEFIADRNSDDSQPIFDTPKKLKMVDIQKDSSMEISENNQVINIDLIKMEAAIESDDFIKSLKLKSPVKNKKCAFKFSPTDKETLQKSNIGMDLESFKNCYLNEVDRAFKCNFNHKHVEICGNLNKLRTAIDFAIEASIQNDNNVLEDKTPKRKASPEESVPKKKRKLSRNKLFLKYKTEKKCSGKRKKRSHKLKKLDNVENVLDLTVNTTQVRKQRKKKSGKISKKNLKTKLSIRNKNIQVKIKWKEEQLKLKITKSETKQKEVKKESPKTLKQYILKFSPDGPVIDKHIVKPSTDVTPLKRKYIKLEKPEKSLDTLKQTTIQNFFKQQPKQ